MTNRVGVPARRPVETIERELLPALSVKVAGSARVRELAKTFGVRTEAIEAHIRGERTNLAPWVQRRIDAAVGIEAQHKGAHR